MKSRALKERKIDVLTVLKRNVFYSLISTFSCGIGIFLWVHNYSLVSYLVDTHTHTRTHTHTYIYFLIFLFKTTFVEKCFPPWKYNPDMC